MHAELSSYSHILNYSRTQPLTYSTSPILNYFILKYLILLSYPSTLTNSEMVVTPEVTFVTAS